MGIVESPFITTEELPVMPDDGTATELIRGELNGQSGQSACEYLFTGLKVES
ncbi:MAG: hypothetical protein R3C59_04755 [Planctomycetaceae bacterium]